MRVLERLAARAQPDRVAIERRRELGFDEDIHLHRQVGHEGHAELDAAEFVLEAARLVIDGDAAVADVDVADREQRLALGFALRLRREAVEHVLPVAPPTVLQHHVHPRPVERHLVQHDATADEGLQLAVDAQHVETQGLGAAVRFHHAYAVQFRRQCEGVDAHRVYAHHAPEHVAGNLRRIVFRHRRHHAEADRGHGDEHARHPLRGACIASQGARRSRTGGGFSHEGTPWSRSFSLFHACAPWTDGSHRPDATRGIFCAAFATAGTCPGCRAASPRDARFDRRRDRPSQSARFYRSWAAPGPRRRERRALNRRADHGGSRRAPGSRRCAGTIAWLPATRAGSPAPAAQ